VKEILMSTAGDLGAPPSEQGAGMINAYQAVNAALSVADENGRGWATGNSLLNNPASASVVDEPNASESVSVAITNTGTSRQHLQPLLQGLGAAIAGQNLTLTLNAATDPTFLNVTGSPRAYIKQTFKVPAGAQHLDAAIAWQSPFSAYFAGQQYIVYLGLIDPSGRDVAYSIPQGFSSGYGHVDVVNPAAGTWTAIMWTRVAGLAAAYTGPVQFSWSAERYVSFGSVSPASFDLAPGATQYVTARFRMPSQPGDQGVAIRFPSGGGWGGGGGGGDDDGSVTHSEIPIALRTLIPIGQNGGSFGGTLTGGNGRFSNQPTQTFAFDVPRGVNNMSLNLQISDPNYLLAGLLVDPNGLPLSFEMNVDASANSAGAMQLNRANPAPGRWRFVLLIDYFTSGNQTTLPFTAQIGFNTAQVSAPGLPNDPHMQVSASSPTVVPITITNTGGLAQAYFADARLEALTNLELGTFPACLPATELPGGCFGAYLPTQTRSVEFVNSSSVPITMDASYGSGFFAAFPSTPDVYAQPAGSDTVTATETAPEVPWSVWFMVPSLVGPYGPAGAPTTPVSATVFARTKAFDAAASADSGDAWADLTLGTNTYSPLVLAPGAAGTIQVTLAPTSAQVGTTVRGFIYIDTFNSATIFTGDEVVKLPYAYTVVP
jgi:hypothetical protein